MMVQQGAHDRYLSFSRVVLELWAGAVASAGSGAPEEICMSCTASAALATGSPACCKYSTLHSGVAMKHVRPSLPTRDKRSSGTDFENYQAPMHEPFAGIWDSDGAPVGPAVL